MAIKQDQVVTLFFDVKLQDGVLIDSVDREHPLNYIHGHQQLFPAIEEALSQLNAGDTFKVELAPEDGYGKYQDELVQRVPADVFGNKDELEVGMRFIAETDIGQVPVEITAIEGDEVVVDGNHPLADQILTFEGEILAVRDATAEEIAHGHIHGEGGCCGGHDHDHEHADCCDTEDACCEGEGCCEDGECSKGDKCCKKTGKSGCGSKKKKEKKDDCCGACH